MKPGVVTLELDQSSTLVEAPTSRHCRQLTQAATTGGKQEAEIAIAMQRNHQPGNEALVIDATIELPNSAPHAHLVCQEIAARFECLNYNEREIIAARTAMYEALSNAMQHGNRNDIKKKLTVSYRIDHTQCVIRVQDEGEGFDPDSLPDPTADENIGMECAGRGWLIMRHFMSEVEICPPGNCVVLTLQRGKKW